jgi:hypothetical protein
MQRWRHGLLDVKEQRLVDETLRCQDRKAMVNCHAQSRLTSRLARRGLVSVWSNHMPHLVLQHEIKRTPTLQGSGTA